MLIVTIVSVLSIGIYTGWVNRNTINMNLKQKILKAGYPLLMGLGKLKGKEKLVHENLHHVIPVHSVYSLPFKRIDGSIDSLQQYKGKKILLVNTASECGYTAQYDELQTLQEKFSGELVVIGFPANDFKEQEKGSNEEIARFCKLNYGVSFPLAAKSVVVKSADQNPVFHWLTHADENGWNDKAPSWNFSKYLLNEKGVLTHYFEPQVSPVSEMLEEAVRLSE
jgi:glutathione peroxidase